MSGHSKWSTIKRKKGAADQKRGQEFSKLIKNISAAVREGGEDPDANTKLRGFVDKAKAINMPADTLKRAIARGSGTLDGVQVEEIAYEGYGPQGVAVLVDCLSDNRNRTTAEVRHILTKYGGSLGEGGCVAWMFDKRGMILVPREGVDADALMECAIENGAADVDDGDDQFFTITSEVADFDGLQKALEAAGFPIESAELTMIPQTTIEVDEKHAGSVIKIMNLLEELDDVQNVYSNFDISDEIMDKLDI
jgi:YebC/PmpR family DNA-binding regulatory protein